LQSLRPALMTPSKEPGLPIHLNNMHHQISFVLFLGLLIISAGDPVQGQESVVNADSLKKAMPDSTLPVKKSKASIQPFPQIGALLLDQTAFSGAIPEDHGDYLAHFPGIATLDLGSMGQESPFAIHGAQPQWTKIYLDGMPLKNPLTGFSDSSFPPINMVSSISTVTSDHAIKIHLADIDDPRPYSRVQFRTGDWGYSDLGLSLAMPLNQKTSFLFLGNRQVYQGYFQETSEVVANQPRQVKHSRYLVRLQHKSNARLRIKAIAMLNRNRTDAPAEIWPDLIPVSLTSKRETSRFDFNVQTEYGDLATVGSSWRANLQSSKIQRKSFNDSLIFDNTTGVLSLDIGHQIRHKNNQLDLVGLVETYELLSDSLGSRRDFLYLTKLKNVWQINAAWNLTIKLTAESFQPDMSRDDPLAASLALKPEMGISHTRNNHSLWFIARYDKRNRSFAERFWPLQGFSVVDKIDNERMFISETGFKLKKDTWIFSNHWYFTHTTEWPQFNDISNDRIYQPTFDKSGRTLFGSGLLFDWDFIKNGKIGVIADFVQVTNSQLQKQTFAPQYLTRSFIEYGSPLFDQYVFFKIRLTNRSYGERFGWRYAGNSGARQYTRLSPASLFDVAAALIFSEVTVKLSFENSFNQAYQLTPGFYMPPRTLRFSIDWEFWD